MVWKDQIVLLMDSVALAKPVFLAVCRDGGQHRAQRMDATWVRRVVTQVSWLYPWAAMTVRDGLSTKELCTSVEHENARSESIELVLTAFPRYPPTADR